MEKLVAGLELDERIAQTAMGPKCDAWRVVDYGGWHGEAVWLKDEGACEHKKCRPPGSPPRTSTDMRYAGQLLGCLFEWAAEHDTVITFGYAPATGYCCTAYEPVMDDCPEHYHWPKADDYYDTPELAICEAALEYLQGEQ